MPTHCCTFPPWRIFQSKKMRLPKYLDFVWVCILSRTKVSFFIHYKFSRCTNFFLQGWWIDWVKRLKLKTERMVKYKTTLDNMIACFEEGWWRKWWKKTGGLWASPRFNVPFGKVAWQCCLLLAVVWLVFFFWDNLNIATFVLNVLVAWGETSSPHLPHWAEVLFFCWNQFNLCQFLCKDIFEVEWIKSQKQSRSSEWQIGGYRCTSWQLFWCSKNNRFKVKEVV